MFARRIAATVTTQPFHTAKRTVFNTQKFWCRENLPVYGLAVGTCAICFQVGVLYPWHEILSDQIERLEVVTARVEKLSARVEQRIEKLEREVAAKESRLLDREVAILKRIESMDQVNIEESE